MSPLFSLIGESYRASVAPFRILLLSLPIFFITSFIQWVLISIDKQKFLMKVYLISAILNVLLNFIFIPTYSYFASSWITVAGEAFVAIALIYKLNKERKNFYGK